MYIKLFLLLSAVSGIFGDLPHGLPSEDATSRASEGKDYWNAIGQSELDEMLGRKLNTNVAKNVILVLGDGMSVPTVTAARIYKGQQEGRDGESNFLSFDKFPHTGLAKTYCVDKQTTDSAAAAAAFLCGVKTNDGVIGVDASVIRSNCTTMTNESIIDSIAQWAQDAGMMTGFVTTSPVTDATEANLYAHSAERNWQCDGAISEHQYNQCPGLKDIALQLIEDSPGNQFNVMMGGGYQFLDGEPVDLPADPVRNDCIRRDNRTLWQEWLDGKADQGVNAHFVRNKTQLNAVDLNETEYLLGVFGNTDMPYEHEIREMNLDIPSLAEMTEAALTILKKGPNGFFLLIEGGKIDNGHHASKARVALNEASAMDDAVLKALQMTSENDTLIVVTADHAHVMTINGYADRGNSILGVAGNGSDDLPYTTLSYANGHGYEYSVIDGEVARMDVNEYNTSSWDFVSQAAVPRHSETHGGDDVSIFALGPMSHLFTSVHEQNYIAHAMAFASCVGANQEHCNGNRNGYLDYKQIPIQNYEYFGFIF